MTIKIDITNRERIYLDLNGNRLNGIKGQVVAPPVEPQNKPTTDVGEGGSDSGEGETGSETEQTEGK